MGHTIPTKKKARDKFDRIIAAADNEFFLNGYDKTTIASIAKAADIAVGTFYLYFDDKLSLYHYILFDYQERIAHYTSARTKECKNRYEKERMGLIAWIEFINLNPHTYNIIFQSLLIDKSLFTDYYKKFSERYSRGLQRDGAEIVDTDYETLSLMLMGISTFSAFKQMFVDRQLTNEEIASMADSIMAILKNGMFKNE